MGLQAHHPTFNLAIANETHPLKKKRTNETQRGKDHTMTRI